MNETLAFLHERLTRRPRVALVLGSGLGALADALDEAVRIPYADIPGFAAATVHGHAGMLVAGTLEGLECLVLQGRYHLYEGHPPERVTLPVRVAAALGARTLVLTSAVGSLEPVFEPGDLVILDDHIDLMWRNPLIGPVLPGDERFPDMSEPYDRGLQDLAERVALERGIRAGRGVYGAVAGPSYETPAEIRMLRRCGATVAGMSIVPEVLAARAMGVRVLAITLVSNLAAGMAPAPLHHEEVLAAGRRAAPRIEALLRGVLLELQKLPDIEVA